MWSATAVESRDSELFVVGQKGQQVPCNRSDDKDTAQAEFADLSNQIQSSPCHPASNSEGERLV